METARGSLDSRDEVSEILDSKGANNPCPRCGNNSFLILDNHGGPMLVVFCANCGLKFEHFVSILHGTSANRITPESE